MKTQRILIFLLSSLLLLLFTSCNPQKRIARKQARWCDPFAHSDTIKSHSLDTFIYETIVEITLPPDPDTLLIFARAYCDSANQVQMPDIYVTDGNNSASISIVNSDLIATIICNEDSLKKIIHIKELRIKELESTKINTDNIRYIEIDVWYKWFFWLVVTLLVASVVVAIRLHFIRKIKKIM